MSAHATTHHHKTSDLAAMQHEIDNIKMHYAPTSEMIRWTVGVGIATVLSLTGIVSGLMLNMNARMGNIEQDIRAMRTESALEHKEMRKEAIDEHREMRKEAKDEHRELLQKIDILIANQKR